MATKEPEKPLVEKKWTREMVEKWQEAYEALKHWDLELMQIGARPLQLYIVNEKVVASIQTEKKNLAQVEQAIPQKLKDQLHEKNIPWKVEEDCVVLFVVIQGTVGATGPLVTLTEKKKDEALVTLTEIKKDGSVVTLPEIKKDRPLVTLTEKKKDGQDDGIFLVTMFHGDLRPDCAVMVWARNDQLYTLQVPPGYDRVDNYAHATLVKLLDEENPDHFGHRFAAVERNLISGSEINVSEVNVLDQNGSKISPYGYTVLAIREVQLFSSKYCVHNVVQFENSYVDPILPGHSGSPIITADGKLVGLVVGGDISMWYGILWKHVEALWPLHEMRLWNPSSSSSGSSSSGSSSGSSSS